jgi:hypothetical protein
MSKKPYLNYGNLEWHFEQDDKTPPRQLASIPLGELDEPITTGRQLLAYLSKCLNKDRYAFRNRGRGSRKKFGNAYGISLDHAEWVAIYCEEKDSVVEKEIFQRNRWKDRYQLNQTIRELSERLYEHQQKYGDDVLIMQKKESA